MDIKALNPTEEAYSELQQAYDFFNEKLFGSRLPRCLIIHARKGRTYGYYCPDRWQRTDMQESIDEIALNPQHFRSRPIEEALSTLAHEMTHLEQQHFGKPGRRGYHNKAWGELMRAIGLEPSNTGAPGGDDTGQQMTHYIVAGGAFDQAVKTLIASGFGLTWADSAQVADEEDRVPAGLASPKGGTKPQGGTVNPRKKSKWKFSCPVCGQNTWGKFDTNVICGKHMERLVCADLQMGTEV